MVFKTTKIALLCASVLASAALLAPEVSTAATPGLTMLGKPDAARAVSFNVVLPLRNTDKLNALLEQQHDPASALYHKWLAPAEFGLRFGPDEASMKRAADALRARGFTVQSHMQNLHVSGTPAMVEQSFSTSLMTARTARGTELVVSTAPMKMPAELAAAGAHVIGFEGREMSPMSRRVTGPLSSTENRYGNVGHYYYDDLKQAYKYPAVNAAAPTTEAPFDGTGVTIGALMSSDVLDSDIALIFAHENYQTVTGKAPPTLFARVPVDGGAPFDPNSGGSFEASLDVQEEITGAQGAHVILYNIPNLSNGSIYDGYYTIVEQNAVDIISSSFGGCEAGYLAKYNGGIDQTPLLLALHNEFLQGNAQGITFLASSGDSAGPSCPTVSYFKGMPGRFVAGASSPATDPNVTGVGGTNVVTVYDPNTLDSAYAGENAWSDPEIPYDPYGLGEPVSGGDWGAGGGASVIFSAPAYQSMVTTGSTMRMTPDIGMQVGGCPGGIAKDYHPNVGRCYSNSPDDGAGNYDRSYVVIALGGARYGVIGTSVSSPEFASAAALLVQKNGRMGNLNPYIYRLAAKQANGGARVYHTMIPGFNGLIQSNISSTYSVSVGVGTPIVRDFIGAPTVSAAGTPQTLSNP